MEQIKAPLSVWDRSPTRRIVAIAFVAGVFFVIVFFFPDISAAYEKSSWLKNLISSLTIAAGLLLAYLEFRHSGEANEHRAELIRLTGEANEYRDKAVQLQQATFELQGLVHQLQASIEDKITKIRLYVRARITNGDPHLLVSNLSEFDLWIDKVELIVTDASNGKPASVFIGSATRLSRGHTEDGYLLWGSLLTINGNLTEGINMKFQVRVVVTGVADDPKTIDSPQYHLTAGAGNTKELKVLNH